MPLTFEQLTRRTRHLLTGAGHYEDRIAELSLTALKDALVIQVDDATEFGKGVIEIGFEQMRVANIKDNRVISLYKFGRGYNGTEPAEHEAGSEVIYQPLFPNSVVKDTVNRVLRALYPSLYVVRTIDVTSEDDCVYLPDDAVGVISAFVNGIRSDNWRWEPDNHNRLLFRFVTDETPIRIVYAARPNELVKPDDDFTLTGFDERIADLIAVGAAAQLAPFMDMARVGHAGMEARANGDAKPAGYGLQVASKMKTDYQLRLDNEIMALHKEHPIRIHKERMGYGS